MATPDRDEPGAPPDPAVLRLYQASFDAARDPICVVDATPVCAFIEALRAAGTRDVATHFATNPGDLGECLARLEVLEANPRFHELFGSSHPGATARDALRGFGPQALGFLGAAVAEHLEGRDPSDLEVPVTDPRGRERYVSIRWSSYAGPKRGSRHLLLAFVDVTKRRQAEDEVRQSERRYRELADMLPEAVFEADATGRLVFVNQAAVRLFGYSRDEIDAGLCLDSLVAGRHGPGGDPNAPARTRSDSGSVEYTARRKDGSVFPVMVRVGPVERDGAPRGLRGVVVDLTERKGFEEKLRRLSRRLNEGLESERRRVALLVHDDIGQNLCALSLDLAALDVAMGESAPQPVHEGLAHAVTVLGETARLASTLATDLRPPLLEELGLPAALRAMGEQFATRHGISFVERIAEIPALRLDAMVACQLFRIAQEALANVARHARATEVTLTLEHSATCLRLCIADNGCGFDPAAVALASHEGGLGHVHMREGAVAAGGSLVIESYLGGGTKICVEVTL